MNATTNLQTKDSEVYEYLRGRILRHELRPGERLREEELCRELNVTRTPLRLAFRRLEHERLIVGEPYRGVHVREIGSEEIAPLFDMREVLEGLAARNVAASGDAAKFAQLSELARICDEAENNEQWSLFFSHDQAFHAAMVRHSHNAKLVEVMSVYDFQLRTFSFHDQYLLHVVEQLRQRTAELKDQHQKLAQILRAGDGEAAEAALRLHVRNSKEIVLAAWQAWQNTQTKPSFASTRQ